MRPPRAGQALVLLAALFAAAPAHAHRLLAEATLDGDEVVLESFFGDGAPAARAEVTARRGEEVAWRGLTDEEGRARFRPPRPGRYVLEVIEPGLHRATVEIDVPAGASAAAPVGSLAAAEASGAAGEPPASTPPPVARGVPWDRVGLGLLVIGALAALLPSRGAPERSWLSRRDDRARLLTAVGLAAVMAAVATLRATVWCSALGVALALSVGLDARTLARRLWPLGAVLLPLLLVTPFHWPSDAPWRPLVPSWSWGPTDVGLERTAALAARVVGIALVVTAALAAAPFDRTIRALQDLRVPAALTQVLLLTYRYLFVVQRDLAGARAALAARGFAPRGDLATARTFAGVVGGLLVRSVARTERVEQAMRCRGYRGALVLPRASGWEGADGALLLGGAALAALLLALEAGWLT